MQRALLVLSVWAFATCATGVCGAADTYQVVHVYPHDPNAFTQGLIYMDGHLYESTGRNGKSTLRMDDLETGRVLQSQSLESK
jgi:glutaminyl-peptide cyclotransferase